MPSDRMSSDFYQIALPDADLAAMPAFSAKVRWRMLHDRNPLLPILQDKVAVKAYAHDRGIATPRTHFVTANPEQIPFEQLPDPCFIKANHGSAWNFLLDSGNYYYFGNGKALLDEDGKLVKDAVNSVLHISREKLIDMCRQMLAMRFAPKEWAYQLIPPKILVEEVVQASDGKELRDYRCFVFDGVVRMISVGSASYRKRGENVFFTPEWQPIALTQYAESLPQSLPEAPATLREMISAAERLGKGVDFLRADFYQSTRGVLLGEITLYPGGGKLHSPTACPRFNRWLANFWKHPGHAGVSWDQV
jgi:hypothetical protein